MVDDHILVETGDFFLHRMRVDRITPDRGDYCRKLAAGRKVLHVGCVDSPIFNPQSNLHLLEPVCDIDGLDTDVAGLRDPPPVVLDTDSGKIRETETRSRR